MADIIKHDDGEIKDEFTLDPTKTKYNLGKPYYEGYKNKKRGEYHLKGHANQFEDYDTQNEKELAAARQNVRYYKDEPEHLDNGERHPGFQRVATHEPLPRPPPKK